MHLKSFKINRLLYLLLALLTPICVTAQSSDKNYVQTKTFLDDAGATFLRQRNLQKLGDGSE